MTIINRRTWASFHRGGIIVALAALLLSISSAAGESPAERDARMQWWREARLGMFVHWGLYSGLAGTWDGKLVAKSGGMEWIQQRVKADTETYAERALPLFKPTPGFAREWAALAKAAGMKYVVFTTKHHDGFSLHASNFGDFNAATILQRDLVREIVDALRAEGLRVGFYHSVIDWNHDQYAYAKSKQLPHPLLGKPYPNGSRDHAKYLDHLHSQVGELMTNYGPVDILWWDFSAVDFQGDAAWRATDLVKLVREKQPGVIMNNRLFRLKEAGWAGMGEGNFLPQLDTRYGDFITPEQRVPAEGMPGLDWESCMTMNTTWGYSDHDHAWKSTETLIRKLCDIAGKGGNLLLNIGPKGDGSVPTESVAALRGMGAWMKVNGEAIYDTAASPFGREFEWGTCTLKQMPDGNTRLFLHVFDWPAGGGLIVPGLDSLPARAFLLACDDEIQAKVTGQGIGLTVPAAAPDESATVIAMDFAEPPVIRKIPQN
jgi:alpha-L-fucosidase